MSAVVPRQSWQLPAFLTAMALVLFAYPLTLGIALFDPDEGLHAAIAQNMVQRGDFITPQAFGKPFRDKPILYFWAEALSLGCFGNHEGAVRLPGMLFGLLGALTTGLLGARLCGPRVGLLAGAFYGTMLLPLALVQSPVHDVALVPWVNLAILWFWEAETARGLANHLLAILKIGAVLGLACLTKGLSGVAVIGLTHGGYLVLVRGAMLYRRLRGDVTPAAAQPSLAPILLRGALALAVAALLAALWYVPMERRNPGYLRYFFLERHVRGFATQSQIHGSAPVWYYLPLLLLGGAPWIAYLPAALLDAWHTRRDRDWRPILLLLVWLVGGMVFFSLAKSKLLTYIWPLFPPVAVLAAQPWAALLEGRLSAVARRSLAATFRLSCWLGPLALPGAVIAAQAYLNLDISPGVWLATLAAAATAALPLWYWRSARCEAALNIAIAAVGVQFVLLVTAVVPQVALLFSARDLARHFNARGEMPSRVLVVEERIGSLVFYLDNSLRLFLRDHQLQSVQAAQIDSWPPIDQQTQIAVSRQWREKLRGTIDFADLPCEHAGRWQIYAGLDLRPRLLAAAAMQPHGPGR